MSADALAEPQPEEPKRESTFRTLRNLWPYMWPHDRPDLKARVAVALGVLVVAKIVTVFVPYTYKWATDALVKPSDAVPLGIAVMLTVPIMLVVANGVGRILMNVFNNLRDALFAKVGQHAVRQLAYKTFIHMHQLSLRYHLTRRTGGLARVIERGVTGIETIVRFTILHTLPTILEFALSAAVIAWHFDWRYLVVVALTVIAFAG